MADKWDEIAAGCWLKCKAAFRQWWKVEEYDQQTVVSIFAAAFREQFEALRNAAQTAEEGWRESDNRVADLEGQVESANNWWRQECAAAKVEGLRRALNISDLLGWDDGGLFKNAIDAEIATLGTQDSACSEHCHCTTNKYGEIICCKCGHKLVLVPALERKGE